MRPRYYDPSCCWQLAADDVQCKSYGIEPGDPAYVQCRTNLDNNHAQVEASEGATATFSAATAISRLIAA